MMLLNHKVDIFRFLIGLDRLAIYTNESESTSFLSLDASNESQKVLVKDNSILYRVDSKTDSSKSRHCDGFVWKANLFQGAQISR